MRLTWIVVVVGCVALLRAPAPVVAEEPVEEIPLGAWRVEALVSHGGDAAREAIAGGLRWLAAHQHESGSWDADGFPALCDGTACAGEGYALYDPGVTGLALLAFLAAGETPDAGPHRAVVARGLARLLRIQDPEGCFGPRTTNRFVYNHASATLAVVEAFARTGDARLRSAAQRAVEFVVRCQNPGKGWRYGVRPQDNDTSVTCWMAMVLRVAEASGLKVPRSALAGARSWIDEVTDAKTGRGGYREKNSGAARPADIFEKFPPVKSAAMTAAALLSRLFLGEPPKAKVNRLAARHCLTLPPDWSSTSSVDMYSWYVGSVALFQMGATPYRTWSKSFRDAVLPRQSTKGCAAGSWDPAGPWGREGGRVYSTALLTLGLQTCYRYPRGLGGLPRGGFARVAAEGWTSAAGADDTRLEEPLDRLVTVAFRATPLQEAAKTLAEAAGVTIRIDSSAAAARGKPVSFSLREKKLRVALGLLAAYAGVKWEAVDGGFVLRGR